MSSIDLSLLLPATLASLRSAGEDSTVGAVMETLGIELAPTLAHGGASHRNQGGALPVSPSGAPRRPEAPKRSEAPPGLSLGRFQLLGELGRGGMGRVMEAHDPQLRREVAVKLIIDPTQVTESQVGRFVAEAQITSQLEHPNIVPVYDMGITDAGELFFVMKKVAGRSLRQVLRALLDGDPGAIASWTRTRLLHAFIQVCNAVAYAHDRGVLHRDLKPDNIMLGAFGEVLLMDWGVARLLGDTTESVAREEVTPRASRRAARAFEGVDRVSIVRTMDGAAIGTPGFMSPEQTAGELSRLDARSDVWSLGAILYELLTLRPAYTGDHLLALVWAVMNGLPEDPRERAPGRVIPDEIAEVCLRALSPARDERYASAGDLARAVETFLEGSKRREAALGRVADGAHEWQRYRALGEERATLLAQEHALDQSLPPWVSLDEKRELLQVRRRLNDIDHERVDRFAAVLAACEGALTQDPESAPARALLAEVHYARFEEAELARDDDNQRFHASRVRGYDDAQRYGPLLRGTGAVSLRTDPPGAEVSCARYDPSAGPVWPLVEPRSLGRTPLEAVALERGSYVLTIRSPGQRDVRYPVFIGRGDHWDSGPDPLPLLTDAEIGPGAVYVPAGPCIQGGDPEASDALARSTPWVDGFIAMVLPVTMREYCEFLSAKSARDPEEAWSRVPRQESGLKEGGGQYWDRPAAGAPYVVPAVDRDGDAWDPQWAVMGVSWHDAMAYANWRAERDGVAWMLPTEREWEKATRGVDGRLFPWGDGFDATLCKMRESRQGRPMPEPVGAFAGDQSPYGVRDLAGGTRDWCGDPQYAGDPQRRPVRGGSWLSVSRYCRAAVRLGMVPWNVGANDGFRLARPVGPRLTALTPSADRHPRLPPRSHPT